MLGRLLPCGGQVRRRRRRGLGVARGRWGHRRLKRWLSAQRGVLLDVVLSPGAGRSHRYGLGQWLGRRLRLGESVVLKLLELRSGLRGRARAMG